ncbi:MAG TPA: tyrosine-type recombinase/integrase [Terriglobia bacterium]|nr:tyrosine-type recombinase/integrase [Terriglobia bacterium]
MPRLTKRTVDTTKPAAGRDVVQWDSELPGFGLRVKPSGRKSYILQFRNRQGRSRRLTLGAHGVLTPDAARRQAKQLLAEVERGADPVTQREKERRAASFAELAELYMERHLIPKGKPGSVVAFRGLLDRHVLPALGRLKVAEVTRADVEALHRAMRGKAVTANRALTVISAIMVFAERSELRPSGSNPVRYVQKYREERRERFLSAEEMGRLGDALAEAARDGSQLPGTILAVRLLALSGMRRTEVLTLKWEYVDLERACIRLPDSKTGRKTVPLGAPALDLLAQAPRVEGNPYVCPGDRHGAPLVGIDKAWARLCKRAGLVGVRIHDLRHSWASVGAAAQLGLPVIGRVLGHSSTSTTQRYAHLADDPLRAAADRVSGDIDAAMTRRQGGEVIPFHKR